jgi:hypothetical protein
VSDKKNRIKLLSEAVSAADLTTENKVSKSKIEMKYKNLRMPKEWDEIITYNHEGTVTAYILMAIKNQMKIDGLI